MSCPFILKTGDREGQPCGSPSKYGEYCGRHIQAISHELVSRGYSSAQLQTMKPAKYTRSQTHDQAQYPTVVARYHSLQPSVAYHQDDDSEGDLQPIQYKRLSTVIAEQRAQEVEARCPSNSDVASRYHKHLSTAGMTRDLLPDDLHQSPDILGEGTYGIVTTLMKDSKDRKEVVVKTFKKGIHYSTFREIAAMRSLSDASNLIHIYGFQPTAASMIKVYMPKYGRTLSYFIDMRHTTSAESKRRLMFGVINGLHCMRNRSIYHRDLKPDNIVLNNVDDLVVIDYGLSRYSDDLLDNKTVHLPGLDTVQPEEGDKTTLVQTLWYRAPEILLGQGSYSYTVDVWSIGTIMLELFSPTDKIASFRGGDEEQMISLIFYRLGTPTEETWPGVTRLPLWRRLVSSNHNPNTRRYPGANIAERYPEIGADPELMSLVKGLLQLDPKRRTTIWDAVRHPYFSNHGLVPTEAKLGRFQRIVSQDIYHIAPDYLAPSQHITPETVKILLRWLSAVAKRYRCGPHAEFLAYRLIRAYLSVVHDVTAADMQGVGCAILLIASNVHHDIQVTIENMVYMCDRAYTQSQMQSIILKVCEVLSFDFYVTTEAHYLDYYGDRYRANRKVRNVATYLTRQLCALPDYCEYGSCEIVSSIYYYTMRLLSIDSNIPYNPDIVSLVASMVATGDMHTDRTRIESSSLVGEQLFNLLYHYQF